VLAHYEQPTEEEAVAEDEASGAARAQNTDEFVHRPDEVANILAPVDAQCDWLRACGFEVVDS
jgi:tRNA (cmo5U34)-methyltransferase